MKCIGWLLYLLLAGPLVAAPPNVLLIFTDDVNYEGFGFTGGKFGPTPHVDALAANGVVFRHAYVTASTCSPSRAGLLTGRYQQRFGHEFNGAQKTATDGLPVEEKTIADRLRALGYRTGAFGKWHLGHGAKFPQYHPHQRGFDEFFGFMGSMVHFFRSDALWAGAENVREPRYLTDVIAEKTVQFIEQQRARPWFAYAAFNFIHTPLQAPGEIADNKDQIKRAMTAAFDQAVGRILAAVPAENTLIFLTNDNGDYTGNGQFRGGKGGVTEGGIRVPFVVQWKGRIAPAVNDTALVSTLDILPTAVRAAGGAVATELDGRDLLPVLRGQTTNGHDRLFWRMGESKAARQGHWKITYEGASGYGGGAAKGKDLRWRLFDLQADPGEATDLSEKHPAVFTELRRAYDAWDATLRAPRWLPGASGEMGQWEKTK
jgi:arylsulfatase A-like enzyme